MTASRSAPPRDVGRREMVKARFAPSPTAPLHVGNARVALANFLFASHHGGRFMLRIDDTDRQRCKPELAAAIETDLRWLGLGWDETIRQSDRLDRYEEAAERLRRAGRLYPCFESDDELRAKRDYRIKRGLPAVYDRAMLRLTAAQRAAAEAGGKRAYWRFLLSDRRVEWPDLVLGRREVKLPGLSDPVLIRRDGTPLHTLASVVDDVEMGVTHVIRGEDHTSNTGMQIDILAALGRDPASIGFAHLPLLTPAEGGKAARGIEHLTLRSLRQKGIEPCAIADFLARLGSSDNPEALDLPALAVGFDLSRFSRSSARFDVAQLLALNRKVLRNLPYAAVADRLPIGATEAFWLAVRGNLDMLSEARGWWDVVAGDIVPPVMKGEEEFLGTALDLLPPEPWDNEVWTTWRFALREETGRTGRALFHPLRLALTGEEDGPELRALLPLMGRARAANRLRLAST